MSVEGGGGSGGRVRGHALADVGRGVRPSGAGHHRWARHVVKVLKQANIKKQRRSVELFSERELSESSKRAEIELRELSSKDED